MGEELTSISCHGTLVEVFGLGMLIQGDSGVGKSDCALGLIRRGHRLVSDDVVKITKQEGYLEGCSPELTRYHMEIRGIGILNIMHLFGKNAVLSKIKIDLVTMLESADPEKKQDRCEILGVNLPLNFLYVTPDCDAVSMIEIFAVNCIKSKLHDN